MTGVFSLVMAALSCTALLGLACQVCKTQAPCHPREFEKEMAERRRAEAELTQVNARLSALARRLHAGFDHRHRPRWSDHGVQLRSGADARLLRGGDGRQGDAAS